MKWSTGSKLNAFTLVELMVGMTLAGIIFAGAFSGMKTGFDIVEEARDQARVTQLLQSEIERMRTLNWTDISALPAKESITLDGALASSYRDRYSFIRTIQANGTDRVIVTITASWQNSGRSRDKSMLTGFSKDGLYDYYYRTL
ncbi:PulJ/GspJ family protein [Cerasicoccus fimbriatus]|uniref:PulJ/GspJ family protein n=1 Tax=Cerasicoccus fimbriatus TaxID=3014554 RepID=UPI0022B53378|nr:type II secretion system protein [Cerasicoccus sp. TK19100]